MVGPQTIWVNYYSITLGIIRGRGVKISSVHYIGIFLANGFGEARSEARSAKVGGLKGRQRGWGSWEGQLESRGSAVSSPSGVRSGTEPRPPKGFPAF